MALKFGRVAVTGAGGMLGIDMVKALEPHAEQVLAWDRAALDVTDLDAVLAMFGETRPEAVVHAAAYTKVDQAEAEPELAFKVNATGTRNVALAANKNGAKMAYVSTDYVFPGMGEKPYYEYQETRPINVYGQSKRAGEWLAAGLLSKLFIIRTSWLYGENGSNFVKTMLKLAEKGDPIRVVGDQIGSPTYTVDLAETIVRLLETEKYGTYHVSNSGSCSWFEFAEKIFELTGLAVDLSAVTSDQFKRPAPRPAYSVLDHSELISNGFPPMRAWEAALKEFLARLPLRG
ncbi:dTDP-4-dehydrorhamnose reductase [Cohnella thailandensis]|uniref:dTDP-4-dehydrorhamnose reductase n=1 Tax=Cohnella thailandensis TaxID=557557 RepID=A0A841SRU8_9BACL|nr:dTDP-4-dehydrorhamnose reductase [Cohnella thailandensis]MBB6635103.1 dTDP-4-dehydrorhamnose reductase [Cohnella thailandensis]MBP1974431.1 dTDP-4-dehydrorhamnose reductase [Cohnella thailandensis]